MAADTKAPGDGSADGQEETTARREFDEADISADDLDESTARREYTEALAKERQLAEAKSAPLTPPETSEGQDLKEMLQPPAHLQEWPEGDRLRVLVVEDDNEAGDKLCQQLTLAGHAALLVGGSEELLAVVAAKQPQLILLRVELTPRSGYLVCNKLKQHDELCKVPLILMSSEATEETFKQHRKLATRADDYLVLPFFDKALLKKISRVTDPNATPAAAAAAAADSAGGAASPPGRCCSWRWWWPVRPWGPSSSSWAEGRGSDQMGVEPPRGPFCLGRLSMPAWSST